MRHLHNGPAPLALGLLPRKLIRRGKLPAALMALKGYCHGLKPGE
jgi:hypothetical protein